MGIERIRKLTPNKNKVENKGVIDLIIVNNILNGLNVFKHQVFAKLENEQNGREENLHFVE